MQTTVFQAKTEKGKLILRDPQAFAIWIKTLGDGFVTVSVAKKKEKRTLNQNAWYWACVVGIPARFFGYSDEEMHDAYKYIFLRKEAPGKPTTLGTTTNMTTEQFAEYCERCRQFAAENGIIVPDPETYAAHWG